MSELVKILETVKAEGGISFSAAVQLIEFLVTHVNQVEEFKHDLICGIKDIKECVNKARQNNE